MSEAIHVIASPTATARAMMVPPPRCPVTTRLATPTDLPFIDQLQKMHSFMVGFLHTKAMEAKIAAGHVLIAEDRQKTPLGYCISQDQYAGRDDVGIVYQLNVLPLRQRHLIGATLIKAVFERAAYGCKLSSCWCAQDLQANFFWEALGFVPLAFRTGCQARQRTHIFWQRRIRDNDDSTPYWFPSQTKSGAMREDRLVLPIPADTHWRDCKPVVLPGITVQPKLANTLPGGAAVRPRPQQPKQTFARKIAVIRSESKHLKGLPKGKAAVITSGGLRYIDRGDYVPESEVKPKREPKPRQVNDPKHVAAARELRDRFLEQVNSEKLLPSAHGKYDVSKALPDKTTVVRMDAPALPAPMAA